MRPRWFSPFIAIMLGFTGFVFATVVLTPIPSVLVGFGVGAGYIAVTWWTRALHPETEK